MKYTAVFVLCFAVIRADQEKEDAKNLTMGLESPYDQTGLLVDYGFLLDNYEAISRSPTFKETPLKDNIKAMIKPIQQYIKSADQEDVTHSNRKSTIIGMLDYLASKESFTATSIAEDAWTINQMSEAVLNRTTLEKAMLTRNALLNGIEKEKIRTTAMSNYRKSLKSYREVLMRVSKKEYDSLVNSEGIDWSLYADRYFELLPLCRGSKAQKHIPEVRLYFAKWLRDGKQHDEIYEKLIKKAGKKPGNAAAALVASVSMLTVALASAVLLAV